MVYFGGYMHCINNMFTVLVFNGLCTSNMFMVLQVVQCPLVVYEL